MSPIEPLSPPAFDRSLRPGRMLRAAREQQGVPADELAAELNIPPAILTALEADDYLNLPEPVFVRGFMRRYADRVGLAPDEIAEQFNECYQADTGRSSRAGLRPNPVQLLGDIDAESKRRRPLPWKRWLFTLAGLLAFALVALVLVRYGDRIRALASGAALTSSPPASSTVNEQVLSGAATVPSSQDRLVLTLQADCRVAVRDADGRELVSGTRKAGEELRLEGVSPFSIELQPASAVRLRFNDQPIDLGPYTVNDIVNFRLSR